jgi:hypothetical protein
MKKSLNEELDKIKGLINKIEEGGAYILGANGPRERKPGEQIRAFSSSDFDDQDDSSNNQVEPEVAIEVLKSVAERVDNVAEGLYNNFKDTPYWYHVKKMYSALKNVSDLDRMHTGTANRGENINDVIEYIQNDFSQSTEEDEENM